MVLAHEIGERIVCAVKLSYGCRSDPQLAGPYGELAGKVRENAPRIVYERGMTALPVDFRSCRSPACSDGPETGRVTRSRAGRPVTAVHPPDRLPRAGAGGVAGLRLLGRPGWAHLHPVLGVLRRLRHLAGLLGARGFHADDWEGVQIRINRDGSVDARASSHNGYNGADAPAVDWASDAAGEVPGAAQVRDVTESLGLRDARGWTRSPRDPVRVGRQPRRSCDRGLAAAQRSPPSWRT